MGHERIDGSQRLIIIRRAIPRRQFVSVLATVIMPGLAGVSRTILFQPLAEGGSLHRSCESLADCGSGVVICDRSARLNACRSGEAAHDAITICELAQRGEIRQRVQPLRGSMRSA